MKYLRSHEKLKREKSEGKKNSKIYKKRKKDKDKKEKKNQKKENRLITDIFLELGDALVYIVFINMCLL